VDVDAAPAESGTDTGPSTEDAPSAVVDAAEESDTDASQDAEEAAAE